MSPMQFWVLIRLLWYIGHHRYFGRDQGDAYNRLMTDMELFSLPRK